MRGQHEMPTASVVRSSQATPARRRGHPCAAINPAAFHLSSPDSCSNGWGHLCSFVEDMGVDAGQAGFMASSALFGMTFGAITLGTLADRIGRRLGHPDLRRPLQRLHRRPGLARDPITFSIMRFLAGLGIGGALPIITAQMAEFAPAKIRRPARHPRLRRLFDRRHPRRADRQATDRGLWLAVGLLRRHRAPGADPADHEDHALVRHAVPAPEGPRGRGPRDDRQARARLQPRRPMPASSSPPRTAPPAPRSPSSSTTAAASAR